MAHLGASTILLLVLISCLAGSVLGSQEDVAAVLEGDDEYVQPSTEGVQQAQLIVHKRISQRYVVKGRNMTFLLSIHNIGSGAAGHVMVSDRVPEGDFDLVDGDLRADIGSLEAGHKHDFEYVVIPRGGGLAFVAPPADVVYSSPGRGMISGLSTAPYVVVLSPFQNVQRYLVEVGKYASLGMLKRGSDWLGSGIVLTVSAGLVGLYFASTALTQTRAEAIRKAAVRKLGIDD